MHKYFSTGQYKNIIKKVHERCNKNSIAVPELTFKGTVKLHGTNGSLYNVLSNEDIVTQSKNNIITPEDDNNGFAKFIEKNKKQFNEIFNNVKQQYPTEVQSKTAVIYGEWAGGSIQPSKELGLAKLERIFVIFAVKLIKNNDNSDENSEDLKDVEQWLSEGEIKSILKVPMLSENRIFNIYDFPTFEVKIDMANPKLTQNILIDITNEVERECPVAKALGVSGIGEGVVWKCVSPSNKLYTGDLVFKVKGKDHSVSNVKTLAEVDTVKVNSIKEFVDTVVTENRLKQGLEYLQEQKLELQTSSMGPFLKWLANDCLKEESDILVESGLDKKEVMPAISQRAKQWFLQAINDNLLDSPNKMKM